MTIKRTFLAAMLLLCGKAFSQITITSADMPTALDTIRISVKTTLPGFQPDSTGANFNWDFSSLVPDSQRVIKCEKPSNTAYALYYGFLATYGIYNHTPDQFPFSLVGTPPTNVYDFYRKQAGANGYLAIVGQGLTIGGQAIPAFYQPADRVYKFPMNYGDKDTSVSGFGAPIPNFGYYRKEQTRVNEVDGWGTLTTPYGTFNTLRVKSTLSIIDSIYLDTLGFGFNIPRQNIIEYKWLANGLDLPVLEIDGTEDFFGLSFTVNRVNWQDSLWAPIGVTFNKQNTCPIVNEGSLNPNVSGGKKPLKYQWSTGDTTLSINNLPPGIYTLTVSDYYGQVKQFIDTVLTLTDSSCLIYATFTSAKTCLQYKNGSLTATVTGARLPAKYVWNTGDTTLTLSNLGVGTYTLFITDKYNRLGTSYGVVEPLYGDATCLNIPNAFTPDGDGTNDVWNIKSLADFTECSVEIFNQWGSLVFRSKGYDMPWDGQYNGQQAPAGAYYFVIDLKNGENKYTGTVTIIR